MYCNWLVFGRLLSFNCDDRRRFAKEYSDAFSIDIEDKVKFL